LHGKKQLEANSPEDNEERAARVHWEELRLRQWKQKNRPNEVEKPLTEEEEAELKELTYRFHPLGASLRARDEVATGSRHKRRPRPK
jgi:hypothetical protein